MDPVYGKGPQNAPIRRSTVSPASTFFRCSFHYTLSIPLLRYPRSGPSYRLAICPSINASSVFQPSRHPQSDAFTLDLPFRTSLDYWSFNAPSSRLSFLPYDLSQLHQRQCSCTATTASLHASFATANSSSFVISVNYFRKSPICHEFLRLYSTHCYSCCLCLSNRQLLAGTPISYRIGKLFTTAVRNSTPPTSSSAGRLRAITTVTRSRCDDRHGRCG